MLTRQLQLPRESSNRSIWKDVVNLPKTRASAAPVPVIRQLADILNAYRSSMGNPKTGVIFHLGDGMPMNFDKLAQRVIRPVVEAIRIDWYGWHGFRRGIASNLYELGANREDRAARPASCEAPRNQGSLHQGL